MFGLFGVLYLLLSALDIGTAAAKHRIIVGTFSTEFLYTLEYDDGIRTLTLAAQSAVSAASSWITFNHDKTKLYGTDWNTEEPTFVSYDVADPYNIRVERKVLGNTMCSGSKSIFVIAQQKEPYSVYGNYYYGDARCSTSFAVNDDGNMNIMQEDMYPVGSAIHGTAITPNGEFLIAADTGGNLIWTHRIDQTTGLLSFVDAIDGPTEGAGPRHIAVHQNGHYVYVVMEESSEVVQYRISHDSGTLSPVGDIYTLLRAGQNPADYWADEVAVSLENKYLWATNRARNNSQKGYISAFELSPAGEIARQMFLLETTTSGGFANSISASPFDDALVALTDNSTGFVQIWHIEDGMIAHLDIHDGQGCCANAVWLD